MNRTRRARRLGALAALTLATIGIAASAAAAAVTTSIFVYADPVGGGSTSVGYSDSENPFPYPQPRPEIAVSIVHQGAVTATQSGVGYAEVRAVPAIGDTVRLEVPPGNVLESMVYNLTIDASTCVGARTISGQRSDASARVTARGARPPFTHTQTYQDANIHTLSGTSYAGTFPNALSPDEYVAVLEHALFTRDYGSFGYSASRTRLVGACPPPPPPPIQAKVPIPPKGSVSVGARRALRAFFKKGLSIVVAADQPGKVVANLFLDRGKLPAKASKRKGKRRRATLIGRGTARIAKPGKVKVTVRPTRSARKLRRKRSLKVAFLTTLSNLAGQTTTLRPKRVTLKR